MDGGTNSTGRRILAAESGMARSTLPRSGAPAGSDLPAAGRTRGLGAHRHVVDEVADVDHAARVVEGLGVDRQARVACGAEDPQEVAQRGLDRHRDDVGARHHDVVDPMGAQAEHVLEHRPFLGRELGPAIAGQRLLQVVADSTGRRRIPSRARKRSMKLSPGASRVFGRAGRPGRSARRRRNWALSEVMAVMPSCRMASPRQGGGPRRDLNAERREDLHLEPLHPSASPSSCGRNRAGAGSRGRRDAGSGRPRRMVVQRLAGKGLVRHRDVAQERATRSPCRAARPGRTGRWSACPSRATPG